MELIFISNEYLINAIMNGMRHCSNFRRRRSRWAQILITLAHQSAKIKGIRFFLDQRFNKISKKRSRSVKFQGASREHRCMR